MLVAGGLTAVTVAPASAGSCSYILVKNYSEDWASVTRAGGNCSQVGVRHYAKPSGSAPAYWTSWFYDTDYKKTYVAPELQTAEGTYLP